MKTLTDFDPWLKPYANHIAGRNAYIKHKEKQIVGDQKLEEFALGHLYFGLHRTKNGWVFREWSPNASKIYIVGDVTSWEDNEDYELVRRLFDHLMPTHPHFTQADVLALLGQHPDWIGINQHIRQKPATETQTSKENP